MNNDASQDDAKDTERRLKWLAWFLDESIPLPGGYRIGVDGIIGLFPGFGDAVTNFMGSYIIFEANRLGAPKSILLRMLGNILLETIIGVIPVAGDIFDFAFKANVRNLRLLQHWQQSPAQVTTTSTLKVYLSAGILLFLIAGIIAAPILLIIVLTGLIT